jgi:hypothetical protein
MPINGDKIHDVFDCARCVVVNEARTHVAVWHGGIVNVYDTDTLTCVDAFTPDPDSNASDIQRACIEWFGDDAD